MAAIAPAFLQPPLVLAPRSRLPAPQRRLRSSTTKCVIEQFNDFTIDADFKTPYASGSFGDVFIGSIQPSNQPVVLKRARNSSIARSLFDKERTINRKLHGIPDPRPRHWPRFLGDYVRESQYFLVWDLEGDGATLASFLSGRPPSALANALGVSVLPGLQLQTFRQVLIHLLLAVGHLHARGVVHRDVKPDNILVVPFSPSPTSDSGAFPPLRLIDFGSSCDVGGLFWSRGIHTLDPLYAAPEERLNLLAPKKFDLFSIGMIAVSVLMPSFADPSRLREFRNALEAADFDLNTYRTKYLTIIAGRNSNTSSFASRDELETFFTSTDESARQAFAVLSGLLKKSPMDRSSVQTALYNLGYSEVPADS